MAESLLDIKKQPAEAVLASLKDESESVSAEAGKRLIRTSAKYGVSLRDYLDLAIKTEGDFKDLTGYEMALAYLSLPVRDDFKRGIVLQAASETFQTFPGTRALFPPVIDDVLYWTTRQNQIEQLAPMLASSRTITGVELLFTIVNDDGSEYGSNVVSELGRIPVRSIRTSEASVKMWKHGSGIRTSYEFNRRARLDLLTPFAARVARELELSKLKAAMGVIVNGDGTSNSAAPVVNQSSYNTTTGVTATAGQLSYLHLLAWLVERAKAGVPVDTVVGNYDAMFQWIKLFQPVTNQVRSGAEIDNQATGVALEAPPQFAAGPVKFVVNSSAPSSKLVGYTRAETLEELREAGSDVAEEERAVLNQAITYVRSEVTGFRLVYKDTRSVLDYSA